MRSFSFTVFGSFADFDEFVHIGDWKVDELGANWNNGASQSIDLKFAALNPNMNLIGFIFQIEGNNIIAKM